MKKLICKLFDLIPGDQYRKLQIDIINTLQERLSKLENRILSNYCECKDPIFYSNGGFLDLPTEAFCSECGKAPKPISSS